MTGRRPPTFRARLTAGMTLLAVGVLAAASAAIYLAARHLLSLNLDNALVAIARSEVASSLDQPLGRVHVHEEGWVPITLPIGTGYEKFAAIKNTDRHVLAQTANLGDGPPLAGDARREAQALAGKASFGIINHGGDRLRALYYPLHDIEGRPLVGIVAVPMQPLAHALDVLIGVLLAALVLGAGAAAWTASRLAGRLTRPLERIAEAARAIGEADLSARIPQTSRDAELHDVTAILNAMLARLQDALQSQRRFVSDASHELRSPLSNLRGTVEVSLRRPRTAEEYRATLADAQAEIERLCRLTEALLALSRADAGQLPPAADPCDLSHIAEAAVRAHRARAAEHGIHLAFAAPGPLPVRGDPDRLRAVLDNLLDNALRYAPPDTPVTVAAERDDGHAVVSVRDAGPGLSAEEQGQVFDRFYRADAARARHSGGVGLGLAIAKMIVDAHGGRLVVDSAPGAGATFRLSLTLDGPDQGR